MSDCLARTGGKASSTHSLVVAYILLAVLTALALTVTSLVVVLILVLALLVIRVSRFGSVDESFHSRCRCV